LPERIGDVDVLPCREPGLVDLSVVHPADPLIPRHVANQFGESAIRTP
jgi:hypothetical protein